MPSTLRKDSTILVIGGGTWGASTALHLARRGYSNVTVLDPYAYPSPISAGNDVNKIVETSACYISFNTTYLPTNRACSVPCLTVLAIRRGLTHVNQHPSSTQKHPLIPPHLLTSTNTYLLTPPSPSRLAPHKHFRRQRRRHLHAHNRPLLHRLARRSPLRALLPRNRLCDRSLDARRARLRGGTRNRRRQVRLQISRRR